MFDRIFYIVQKKKKKNYGTGIFNAFSIHLARIYFYIKIKSSESHFSHINHSETRRRKITQFPHVFYTKTATPLESNYVLGLVTGLLYIYLHPITTSLGKPRKSP